MSILYLWWTDEHQFAVLGFESKFVIAVHGERVV